MADTIPEHAKSENPPISREQQGKIDMHFRTNCVAALAAVSIAGPTLAGTTILSGTRSNVTPGGSFGGRCAPAITVSFGPGAFSASGTSNLGAFSYTASHCIAAPPPGSYYDGQFEWTLDDGTLFGTHDGILTLGGGPGLFNVVENLLFTGGTGRYLGASGFATFTGTVQFGMFNGAPGSTGEGSFTGRLSAPAIPEPGIWALMIAGFGIIGASARRRKGRVLA